MPESSILCQTRCFSFKISLFLLSCEKLTSVHLSHDFSTKKSPVFWMGQEPCIFLLMSWKTWGVVYLLWKKQSLSSWSLSKDDIVSGGPKGIPSEINFWGNRRLGKYSEIFSKWDLVTTIKDMVFLDPLHAIFLSVSRYLNIFSFISLIWWLDVKFLGFESS